MKSQGPLKTSPQVEERQWAATSLWELAAGFPECKRPKCSFDVSVYTPAENDYRTEWNVLCNKLPL